MGASLSTVSVRGGALMALPNNHTSGLICNNLFLGGPPSAGCGGLTARPRMPPEVRWCPPTPAINIAAERLLPQLLAGPQTRPIQPAAYHRYALASARYSGVSTIHRAAAMPVSSEIRWTLSAGIISLVRWPGA
jgi:hypothetical protein